MLDPVPSPLAAPGGERPAVQRAGGASILLDDELTPESLAERMVNLIDHHERLSHMAERARAWSRPDTADALADVVVGVAR